MASTVRVSAKQGERLVVALPAFCITCGYSEVPGEDFNRHECSVFRDLPESERALNEAASLTEAKRRIDAARRIDVDYQWFSRPGHQTHAFVGAVDDEGNLRTLCGLDITLELGDVVHAHLGTDAACDNCTKLIARKADVEVEA